MLADQLWNGTRIEPGARQNRERLGIVIGLAPGIGAADAHLAQQQPDWRGCSQSKSDTVVCQLVQLPWPMVTNWEPSGYM